jgi:hypothetical protein
MINRFYELDTALLGVEAMLDWLDAVRGAPRLLFPQGCPCCGRPDGTHDLEFDCGTLVIAQTILLEQTGQKPRLGEEIARGGDR